MKRQEKDEATRKILQMTVDGKRNCGRPKLRWEDLGERGYGQKPNHEMAIKMAEDGKHWHVIIRAGTLLVLSLEAER